MSNECVVDVKNLTVGYGDIIVLQNISFSVSSGEIFVILGGSGCGKSTLLKHMIGLYTPFRGDVLIFGESMVNSSEDEKRKLMRRFGVTYQGGALFGSLTVAENIALPPGAVRWSCPSITCSNPMNLQKFVELPW